MFEDLLKTYLPIFLSLLFSILAWSINRHLKNIENLAHKLDNLKDAVIKNETITKMQQDMIADHIKSINKVDTKLDAIFRYIDAPTRKSDV